MRAFARARACANCGASTETGSFCRLCGARLNEQQAGDGGEAVAERRLFRSGRRLRWVAVAAPLALGLALLVAASEALAALLFLGAVALVVAWRARGRGGRLAGELRARARFVAETARAWSRTGRRVAVLRAEARRVRSKRLARVNALGEAALREDEPAVAALREEVRALDRVLYEREVEMRRLVEGTRRHVERERLPFQPTRVIGEDAEHAGATAEPQAGNAAR